MVRKVYADNRQFSNIDDLKTAISKAWDEIDQETIDNLILSMDNRIFQVINRNGDATDY